MHQITIAPVVDASPIAVQSPDAFPGNAVVRADANTDTGFIGGEGLENDLTRAAEEGRLFGILNGCEYTGSLGRRPGWQRLLMAAQDTAEDWQRDNPGVTVHELAVERLKSLPKRRPLHVLTSVGRIVSQKMQLFFEPLADGRSALEHLLDRLGRSGVLMLLGSGESDYEERLEGIAARLRLATAAEITMEANPGTVECGDPAGYRDAGVEPEYVPIRGGTDGARLSYMGLPCPNIFAGEHSFHSKREWASVQDMQKAVQTIVTIAALYEQKA